MLLEFSCSNHKSIKDRVTFSMLASKDDTMEETLKEYSKYQILRSSVIYGANGSGKSNFLDAIMFMQYLVMNSINFQPGQIIFQKPHKLSESRVPSAYQIHFVKDGIRYVYGFSIVERLVEEEYLYYFPKGRQVNIFERKSDNTVISGKKFKGSFDLSLSALKENRLFLSCAANFSKVKEIEKVFLFFSTDIVVYSPEVNNWMEYSLKLMEKDENTKRIFLDFLSKLGTGIKNIDIKTEKVTIESREFLEENSDFAEWKKMIATVIYDGFETNLKAEESSGVQKMFEILCPIIDIIKHGKVLLCDEFEKGLHEKIVHFIIETFKNAGKEPFAQFVFSTHDTSLLDSELFRRDQIWFTELKEDRSTDLYSLAEIRNVRKTENLLKGYISGKYGAIPMLNQNFLKLFSE